MSSPEWVDLHEIPVSVPILRSRDIPVKHLRRHITPRRTNFRNDLVCPNHGEHTRSKVVALVEIFPVGKIFLNRSHRRFARRLHALSVVERKPALRGCVVLRVVRTVHALWPQAVSTKYSSGPSICTRRRTGSWVESVPYGWCTTFHNVRLGSG